ncbi:MAG: peptidoglycan DD-metalloendopeptidase family protein [Rhodothermales bacterium]|nr:peptidoglycan DD-metalloendopeptidase family protein [Rhodothermales bacterium]
MMTLRRPGPSGRSLAITLVVCSCSLALGCSGAGDAESDGGAPVFRSAPVTSTDHNRPYVYQIEVADPDGDETTVSVPVRPGWMAYDPETKVLAGTAGWDNIDRYSVSILASDGQESTRQNFSVTVTLGEIVCDQDFGDPSQSAYVLPYRVGATYDLSQGYCPPNPAWGHHDWFAYDFDMAIGDTVLASRGGEVLFVREDNPDNVNGADCSGGKENFVFILHDDGTVMQYVHLTTDGALVSVGERVLQAAPIGLSGDSGCSIGPHLHVALFRDRNNFDRQSTLAFNYLNAAGSLDMNNGLQTGGRYEALPY